MKAVKGNIRRYHIESVIHSDQLATVYKAFARHRAGKSLRRRYYALLSVESTASFSDFNNALQHSLITATTPLRIEEEFVLEGIQYVVVAKGEAKKRRVNPLQPYYNKGYLMLVLAAIIFILLIVKHFQ